VRERDEIRSNYIVYILSLPKPPYICFGGLGLSTTKVASMATAPKHLGLAYTGDRDDDECNPLNVTMVIVVC